MWLTDMNSGNFEENIDYLRPVKDLEGLNKQKNITHRISLDKDEYNFAVAKMHTCMGSEMITSNVI